MKALHYFKKFESWHYSIAQKWGVTVLRYSLAIIYIWFGILKPLGISPACELITQSVTWFSPKWFIPLLGIGEVFIGLLLLFRRTVRYAVLLIYLHLPCTFLPFLVTPTSSFSDSIFELTLAGQYMVKNVTLIAAAFFITGASLKGKKNELASLRNNLS